MLTLLENDKRGSSEAVELAYRKDANERVSMPENLFLIGTMNVADRSLAIVDFALRRRFAFVDLEPRFGSAWRAWCARHGLEQGMLARIEAKISALNVAIAQTASLKPQYRIGHSFVTPDSDERIDDARAFEARSRRRSGLFSTSTGTIEFTTNTPRNRLVRGALERIARVVRTKELARRCRLLAGKLERLGVNGAPPSHAEAAADRIDRNDAADRSMVALAKMVFELAFPTEEAGEMPFVAQEREEAWVRRLFEKAVLGFARVELEPLGWRVIGSKLLRWQVSSASNGLAATLPRMLTDIVLDAPDGDGRLVVDTKFTSILAKGRFGELSLKSEHIYQMYAYLRSQEGKDARWNGAAGMLLHPAVDASFRERAVIQGHPISFATVDLAARPVNVRNELRSLLCSEWKLSTVS